MQNTPKGLRLHIGFFGRRNVGKSSLVNALVGQEIAIISDTPGTTTDPVEKSLEFAPLGPVVIIDTAGIDDEGELGTLRKERSFQALHKVDLAVLVVGEAGWGAVEEEFLAKTKAQNIPCCLVQNKSELCQTHLPPERSFCAVSAKEKTGLDEFRAKLVQLAQEREEKSLPILSDLLPEQGTVVLVVPLDSGAPKGRLILPQVQTIRDALDGRKLCLVVTEQEFPPALNLLKKLPDLVVADSQIIHKVAAATPAQIPLTTFSILMARQKGDLAELARGAACVQTLKPGDRVLIQEACAHHPQKDDIGRVKIPRLLQKQAGGPLQIDMLAGKEFTELGEKYKLVVHCGACTMTRKQMLERLYHASSLHIPMTNYGMAISAVQGVLERVLSPFPEALQAYREVLA